MTDLALIQQTERSLAALKEFASQSNNVQLLDHVRRLEGALRALAAGGDSFTMGDIRGSTVAIGRDINLIVNQVLPPTVKLGLENIQRQWSAAHLEIRQAPDRGGHVFLSYPAPTWTQPCASARPWSRPGTWSGRTLAPSRAGMSGSSRLRRRWSVATRW